MVVTRFEDQEQQHKIKIIALNSMSQDYIFNFSHGFQRPSSDQDQQPQPLMGLEDEGTGMLSEMFNFPTAGPATELLQNQINYRNSAQAMQLFLMNPSHESPSSSTLHMFPSSSPALHHQQSFGSSSVQGQFGPSTQFTWVPPGGGIAHEGGGDSHGLSLSLSSTLQHLEGAKVEELRIGDNPAMFYFNQGAGGGGSDPYRHMGGGGGVAGPTHHPSQVGYGSSLGVVKALRTSRYVKAAQELLEEFCSVGRSQFKINKSGSKTTPNQNPSSGGGGGASSASSKDPPSLSSAERIEHQRRKSKLLSMLDEASQSLNFSLSLYIYINIVVGINNGTDILKSPEHKKIPALNRVPLG
ncbi:hypothetical protein L1987_44107 [Smallanthus sonchifolius]|uniref:Uncharacterized protein n=1 Tax=Smallanthus sonchifolius TaxID=185202 RepID=A0ACB9GNI4_9ASTR|nr:hypothetical protein L1987_44107 [Smallanthus sonchifolius]